MDISRDTKSNPNLYICIMAIFLCLVFFYVPSMGGKFGYLNDYTIFEYNPHQCCLGFPETIQLFAIGRPIQAWLLNFQLMFVNGIDSLQPMRIFFAMMICFAASIFFVHIQRNFNINRYTAMILSLLMFTLPSMTINSFWVAQSIPGIVPIFFVLLAHSIMQLRGAIYIRCICLITAFVLIFISLFIYPPATFFFLTLTLIALMFGTKDAHQTKLRNIYIEIALLLTSCLVYFLTIKYIYKPMLIKSHFGGMDFLSFFHDIDVKYPAYKFSLSFDPTDKIARFYDLFRLIFSIWFSPLRLAFIIPIMIGFWSILAYASLDSPYLKHLNRPYRIILGLSLATFILLLSPLPVIIGQGYYSMLYRVTFAPMAIIAVALVFIMDRVFQMTNIGRKKYAFLCVVGILILAGEVSSYHRLVLMATRLSAEYSHVFTVVKRADDTGSKEIMIPPLESPPDPRGLLFRDFGYTAVNSITLGMVNAALQELGRDEAQYHVRYDPLGPRYVSSLPQGIRFNQDGYPFFVSSIQGISGKEPFGRWTDGDEAKIEFTRPLPKHFILKITAKTFSGLADKPVRVIIGGVKLETTFSPMKEIEFIHPVISDGHTKTIIFEFPHLQSPKELGMSNDSRHLGLALISLKISDS